VTGESVELEAVSDFEGRHILASLHVEVDLKSSAAANVAHVKIDIGHGRQRRIDEQAADIDALTVAGLRDLQPVLDGLGARDQRIDVRQLRVGQRRM